MANGLEHQVAGGLAALAAEWIAPDDVSMSNEERCKVRAAAAFGGILGGMFPDKIEPALHPNHRSHFHSLVAVGAICWAVMEISRYQPASMTERYWIAVGRGFFIGYFSHLMLDASTPKSLPLI